MKKEEIVRMLIKSTQEYGLVDTLGCVIGKNIHVNVDFTKTACEASIDELTLSVRSNNALRRSGIATIGELITRLNEGDLKSIRNLGNKSVNEIKTKVLVFGFDQLSEKGKMAFLYDLVENNTMCGALGVSA